MKIYNLKTASLIHVHHEIDALYNMNFFKQLFTSNWYRITVLLRYYLLVMMDSNCIHVLTTASLKTDLATSLGENSPTVSDMSSVSLG